ncbi:MAG TPA: non-heme iron oxygenase ferredoxin subunit [Leptospiraceae bacterium]|nr:non-heme iron oxygenase ferredoxin subunit [Leptospiraceae bacterium]HMW08315.1 non-heme iron oxygenase ferredoxin subunit [Leptospiraceae bacterium]HMX33826.1 non-heme iron oxygenase ferredoxin subunit [Leptospiraceae bacterium]HMY34177.1 non-heme iron oxygenase ferredoxin subunit [Leptospiraceae bacterium]HMZ66900.1 non-heme iron oxygenase ferredoxin subunit [Leptospiraceae bacterium]
MYKKLINVAEVKEGLIKVVKTKYANIAITKLGEDFIAFEDVCTHDGEEISSGKIESGAIICPRHFAKFDLKNGKALCMPATEDLVTFPVRISDNMIEVDIED